MKEAGFPRTEFASPQEVPAPSTLIAGFTAAGRDQPPAPRLAYRIVKRGGDLAFALTAIVGLAPLLLLLWFVARSRGPALDRVPHLGADGRSFGLYRFRVADAPAGRVLRRARLDRLPVLFNILLGDLALVGPKAVPAPPQPPMAPSLAEAPASFRHAEGEAAPACALRPGLIGPASLPPGALTEADYAARPSLRTDLSIIVHVLRHGPRVRGSDRDGRAR